MYFILLFLVITSILVVAIKSILSFNKINYKDDRTQIEDVAKSREKSSKVIVFSLVKSVLRKNYNVLKSLTVPLKEYEKWLYDNYYKIFNNLNKNFIFCRNLPSINHTARVYSLVKICLKKNVGELNAKTLKKVIDEFNLHGYLRFAEICAIKEISRYALVEYLSIYASRSTNFRVNFNRGVIDSKKGKIDLNSLDSYGYLAGFSNNGRGRNSDIIRKVCENNGINFDSKLADYKFKEAEYSIKVANAVLSLKSLDESIDLPFALSCSKVNDYLLEKAGDFYDYNDDNTKWECLKLIAKKSRKGKELAKAREVANISNRNKDDVYRVLSAKPMPEFVYTITKITTLVLSAILSYFVCKTLFNNSYLFVLFLPISYCLLCLLLSFVLQKKEFFMPRVKRSKDKCAIIISCLINDENDIEDLKNRAKTIKFANRNFDVVVLADFKSCKNVNEENDKKLFDKLTSNEYITLVRKRSFDGQKYEGWEKKRGAIIDFNALILGEYDSFAYKHGKLDDYAYAITLDSDSTIIYAERALNAISHPYFNDYCILSFSSSKSLGVSKTLFSRLFFDNFSGYNGKMFSLENDYFHRGNYTGKGIYRIKEFNHKLKNAFENRKILSHDFIEGAVANCFNIDVNVCEDVPLSFSQYLHRECRWIRGDFQLLPFLLCKRKNRFGNKVKNNIGQVNRWHIFDGIIRPISGVLKLLGLFFSLYQPLFLLFVFSEEILSLLIAFFNVLKSPKQFLLTVTCVLYQAITLPITACYKAYSIFITLVRLIIRKNLLQWNTFRHSANSKISKIPNFIFSTVMFIITCINFSTVALIFSVLFAYGLFLEILEQDMPKNILKKNVRTKLYDVLNLSWGYFQRFLTNEYDYLVPDNYSEETDLVALRTSPTNIGLSLISLTQMYRLQMLPKSEFEDKSDKILESVEKLEKYKGHLYNWYSITDKQPMFPRYVSSVDSGNFCMSLLFCYGNLSLNSKRICDNFIKNCDFDFLIDKEKNLIYTGFNTTTNTLDSGRYDILASESLLTYIFCIGYGKIDVKSAYALDRSEVSVGGKAFYSWTGGMFEYLMPLLYVNFAKDGAIYNSMKTAVKSQMKSKEPFWGSSESQYDSFDDAGNRKYKAFGDVRVSYSDVTYSVKSPYASFICSQIKPDKVVKNVVNMDKNGMRGKIGYYESYDKKPIKTYMAHHSGMTICAIANALMGVENRLETPTIRSALLYLDGIKNSDKVKRKILREKIEMPVQPLDDEVIYDKNFIVNNTYSLMISDNGICTSLAGVDNVSVYDESDVFVTVNGVSFSILKGAKCEHKNGYSTFITNTKEFDVSLKITASNKHSCEIREVEFYNKSPQNFDVKIAFYFNPILCDKKAYIAHKTYKKLFIDTLIDNDSVYAYSENLSTVLKCSGKVSNVQNDRGLLLRGYKSNINVDACMFVSTDVIVPSGEKRKETGFLVCAKNKYSLNSKVSQLQQYSPKLAFDFSVKENENAIASNIKNLVSGVFYSKSVANLCEFPCIAIKIKENGVFYGIREYIGELVKCSIFTSGIGLCFIYNETSRYYKETLTMLENNVNNVLANNKHGEIKVFYLERNSDKKIIESLEKSKVVAITDFPVYKKLEHKLPLYEITDVNNNKEILYKTDFGGFTKNGFLIDEIPPKAWSNVVSNGQIGFISTESGGGYTFLSSSREEKITNFSFDPIVDTASEGIVLQRDSVVWSTTKNACMSQARYKTYHDKGKTVYYSSFNGVSCEQKVGISGNDKGIVLKLENKTNEIASIDVLFFARLVLGDFIDNTKPLLRFFVGNNSLFAVNCKSGLTVYLNCSSDMRSHTFDYSSICDKSGKIASISKLNEGKDNDSLCYVTHVDIAPNSAKKVVFTLGINPKPDLVQVENRIENFCDEMNNLSPVKITSNSILDVFLPWTIYQSLSSRFYARCGFYQIGGAYGFRDQLQDCLALLYYSPNLVREHILYCAQHQFESGDVMHWWHDPYFGVRTKISDNRLFLPYLVAKYIKFTGKTDILNEQVPYLKNEQFNKVLCKTFTPTSYSGSIYEHVMRAIRSVTFTKDGLCAIGDGDWNDAMNKAGEQGKGSSVWLSMFLYYVLNECAFFINDKELLSKLLSNLKVSVNRTFNGSSYARLIRDNGKLLGYDDGFVDLITQAFSVISGIGDKEQQEKAIKSASALVDEKNMIVKLLSPAFDKTTDVGSIGEYPKGVRENGGQYTHGALWYVMALYIMGENNRAYEILNMILPYSHSVSGKSATFKIEPYVVCADIYSYDGAGEGGWSWYTGSASWAFVIIVEYLLGIKKEGDVIKFNPALPDSIAEVTVNINFDNTPFCIEIHNTSGLKWSIFHDEVNFNTNKIRISNENKNKKFKLVKI